MNHIERALRPLIISLCDYTGNWPAPYAQSSMYDVETVEILRGQDVREYHPPADREIRGVLAAPPCTFFSLARNRHKLEETQTLQGLELVIACLRVVAEAQPKWWALENPKGKLKHWLGEPDYKFDPSEFGAGYTKRTWLWGKFAAPVKTHWTTQEDRWQGAALHNSAQKGDMPSRSHARAVTPPEFARAFFLANP